MKILILLALLGALFLPFVPGLLAEDDDEGSKFGDPTEEAEPEPEPEPLVIPFKDYRLEMETEDGRWWKIIPIPADEQEKGVVIRGVFKLPKSENAFDISLFCQAWKHGGNLQFNDGSKMGTDNYKGLCQKYYDLDIESWKEVRDPEKPKARKISRTIKKAYRYALTGLNPHSGNMPMHKEVFLFKWKDKTYFMVATFTTGSFKNERVVKEFQDLLKSMREKKRRRR